MAVSESFRIFALEQLARVADVSDRRMFGGVGIYAGEYFFSIIADNTLFFKVDDSNRSDFEEAGMEPFRPYGPDGETMSYYQVPAEVLEDEDRLRVWVEKAVAVARDARRRKPKKKKKA